MIDSLWRSTIKAFLVTFAVVIGIFLAFIPMVSLIDLLDTSDDTVENDYTAEIVANAEGVRKKEAKKTPVVLEIDIHGMIGAPELTQQTIRDILTESRESSLKNDRVKAVLLNINTPGGTMDDADGIYRALMSYKAKYKVPVIAYVDGLCASGGMYVACAADEVYASDVSLVGSVGVIAPAFMNFSKLLEKIGVDSLTIYAGKGKDELDPFRPWKPDEDKNIRAIIEYYYNSFVDLVTKHRPRLSKEALVNEYGAGIFPASQAVEFGYIDGAGETRESALKKVLAKIGIEDDYYQVVKMKSTSWISQLFKTESPIFTGKIQHELYIEGQLPKELLNKPLYLYRP